MASLLKRVSIPHAVAYHSRRSVCPPGGNALSILTPTYDIKTIALHRALCRGDSRTAETAEVTQPAVDTLTADSCVIKADVVKEYNGKLFMGNLHGHRLNRRCDYRKRGADMSPTATRTSC